MADTVLVAALSVLGGFVVAYYTRNREESWTKRRDVARDRREAYGGYLVGQQALRDEIEVRRKRMGSHRRDRSQPLVYTQAWRDSGAAEMNARLVASDPVFNAIDAFEKFADPYTKALERGDPPPGDWERERSRLIRDMRAELTDYLGDAPRGRVKRAIDAARAPFRTSPTASRRGP